MITWGDIGDLFTNRLYNASGLVPHDSGEWCLVRSSQKVVIAVANAGRGRLD
jgi:hypothetical protein